MAETADVVIVGGGSTGTSIAWQLAKMSAGRVVLLERRGLAAQATGITAGIVRTHYTHETLARMALRARQVFENFDDEVGGAAGFRQTGFLALLGPDDVETVAANVAMHRELGINTYILSSDEIREVEPRLALFGIGAAAWEPESGYADPVRTAHSFASAARRHGAELRIGVGADRLDVDASGIVGIETNAGYISTRAVVVANGYSSRHLVAPLGLELPLTPVRHAVAFMQRAEHFGKPHPIISDRVAGSYYRPREDGQTMVGKTAPYDGDEDGDADAWPAATAGNAPDPRQSVSAAFPQPRSARREQCDIRSLRLFARPSAAHWACADRGGAPSGRGPERSRFQTQSCLQPNAGRADADGQQQGL